MKASFSIADHARAHGAILAAERLASYTLTSIRGMTAEQVAAAVASRAIASLRSKAQREGAASKRGGQ